MRVFVWYPVKKTGFAYSDRIELSTLLEAAKNVKAIARQGQNELTEISNISTRTDYYQPINPLKSLADQEKINLLRKVDTETRKLDNRIEEVMVSLVGVHEKVLIANQDGSLAADVRPLTRMSVTVIMEGKWQAGTREWWRWC